MGFLFVSAKAQPSLLVLTLAVFGFKLHIQGVSEYGLKSDWENRWSFRQAIPNTNRESQQYSGTALGRLRVRFEGPLGKPMALYFKPFLKPIGRASSTQGQPYTSPNRSFVVLFPSLSVCAVSFLTKYATTLNPKAGLGLQR